MMNKEELQLLNDLQTIKDKLDNNIKLNDYEYKLFTSMLFIAAIGITKQSLNYVSMLFKGNKDDE